MTPSLPTWTALAVAALISTLTAPALAQFPANAVLALRVGEDSATTTLSTFAAPMFLDVFVPGNPNPTQTIALPTIRTPTANSALAYATSNAEGVIATSGDGTLLVLSAYSAPSPAFEYPAHAPYDVVPRVAVTIDCRGVVNTSASIGDAGLGQGNVRAATSFDGSYFYFSTEEAGFLFLQPGSPAVRMDSPAIANPRSIGINYDAPTAEWRLYLTASTGVDRGLQRLGTGASLPFPQRAAAPSPLPYAMLPGFEGLTSGVPHQWVFEPTGSPMLDSLWLAEAGIAHWTRDRTTGGAGTPWAQPTPPVAIPPHPEDATAVSPNVRGLVGGTDPADGLFTLYLAVADAIGVLRPRIMSYKPSTAVFTTIATSPAVGRPYKGVALPPACVPIDSTAGQQPRPTPPPTYVPIPSPAPSVVTITANVTAVVAAEEQSGAAPVSVTISVSSPSNTDFLAVFAPAGANTSRVAPLRVADLSAVTEGAYLTNGGTATLTLRLPSLLGGYKVAVMRGRGAAAAQAFPLFDAWLTVPSTELPGAITLTNGAENSPVRRRIMPGASQGSVRIGWTTASPPGNPRVVWGVSATALTNTVPASSSRVTMESLCPDYPPELRSIAISEGWMDLGTQYIATLTGLTPGSVVFYAVEDTSYPNSRSSVLSFLLPPPLARLLPAVASPGVPAPTPAAYLLVADTGTGTDDSTVPFRNRGAPSLSGFRRMAADIDASEAGQRARFLGTYVVGDMSYGDGLVGTWSDWQASFAGVSSRTVFTWVPGNHEAAYGARDGDAWAAAHHSGGECNIPPSVMYPMPRTTTPTAPWFWTASGPIAFVHMSTEHPFTPQSPQLAWLTAVLPSINRSVTPYLVLLAHRPFAVSSGQDPARADGHILISGLLRANVLPLAAQARVNLIVSGHHHSFQRHCILAPPNNYAACLQRSYAVTAPPLSSPATAGVAINQYDALGPVSIIIGAGGVETDLPEGGAGAATMDASSVRHSYLRLYAAMDGSALEYELVAYDNLDIVDRVRILQSPSDLLNAQASSVASGASSVWTAEQMAAGVVGPAELPPTPSATVAASIPLPGSTASSASVSASSAAIPVTTPSIAATPSSSSVGASPVTTPSIVASPSSTVTGSTARSGVGAPAAASVESSPEFVPLVATFSVLAAVAAIVAVFSIVRGRRKRAPLSGRMAAQEGGDAAGSAAAGSMSRRATRAAALQVGSQAPSGRGSGRGSEAEWGSGASGGAATADRPAPPAIVNSIGRSQQRQQQQQQQQYLV